MNGFVSYFLSSNGYSEMQVGINISLANLLSLTFQPFAAQFADKSLHIRLQHIITLFSAISIVFALSMLAISAQSHFFIALHILILFIVSLQVPLITSLATEHINAGTPVNFNIARGIGSVAFAAMSILMGMLTKNLGPNVTLIAFSISALLYLTAVLRFPRAEKPSSHKSEIKALNLVDFIRRNHRFMMSVVAMFFIYSSAAIISSFLFQIVSGVGGDSDTMGKMLAMAASVELISMLCYPIVYHRLGSNAKVIKISSIAFLIKAIATWQATSIGSLYFAQFLQFFSYGFFIPAQVHYVLHSISRHDQVKGQMFMSFSTTLAVVFASLAGGYLLQHFGLYNTLLFGVILTIVGLIILFRYLEEDNK